jgi:hypothetical protein
VYNNLVIVRRYNNNKLSLKSFKKLSKLRLKKQHAIISFNLKKQPVLSKRRVKRRLESRKLQRKLKETIVKASTTLLKL